MKRVLMLLFLVSLSVCWPAVATSRTSSGAPELMPRVTSSVAPELAAASLTPTAQLTASGGQGLLIAGSVATLAASTWGGTVTGAGTLDVWGEPDGGWSSAAPPATATIDRLYTVAVGDRFVAAEIVGDTGYDPDSTEIFASGPDGWSGALSPSATVPDRLVAAGPDTIITQDTVPDTDGNTSNLDVFVEPDGGWASTSTPDAELEMPGYPVEVSASQNTIAALNLEPGTENSEVTLFSEPADGWSGSLTPTATIPIDGQSIAVSDDALVILGNPTKPDLFPVYVIRRSAAGWQPPNSPRPAALLRGFDGDSGGYAAISGSSATLTLDGAPSVADPDGVHLDCPCESSIYTLDGITAPAVAAPVSVVPAAEVESINPSVVADGTTVEAETTTGVDLFRRATA